MVNPKKVEHTALIGLGLQFVFMVLCFIMLVYARGGDAKVIYGIMSLMAEFYHLGIGLVVWLLVFFHGRTRRLARQEQEERERTRTARLSEELFDEMQLDSMSSGTILRFFEKYVVTIASILLGVGTILVAARLGYATLRPGTVFDVPTDEILAMEPSRAAAIAVGLVFITFVGFLIGKYAAGLAQEPGMRLLRAAGGYVMGNVITCVLVLVSMGLYSFDVVKVEATVALIIPGIMMLVGFEMLVNLVLDIYRPHGEDTERRPAYDSRLLGLFAEPGGVLKTVASTLDYQFGFKVSETWFYRFLERAIMPLLLVQIASLWLLTCIVSVAVDEVAFMETFGRIVRDKEGQPKLYAAGFYLKAPWPFMSVRHVPAYEIHEYRELGKIYKKDIGSELLRIDVAEEQDRSKKGELLGTFLLWNVPHVDPEKGKEVGFLAAGAGTGPSKVGEDTAVNIAHVGGYLHYRLKCDGKGNVLPDAAYVNAYRQADVDHHVRLLARRALCRMAATQDFVRWMSVNHAAAVDKLKGLIQEGFDRYDLGLEVVAVGIKAIHPPVQTCRAFQSVSAAVQDKRRSVTTAHIDARMTRMNMDVQASEIRERARASADTSVKEAEGRAELFKACLELCRSGGPESGDVRRLLMFRTHAAAMEAALPGQEVFIVPNATTEVDVIDLEHQMQSQLMENLGERE